MTAPATTPDLAPIRAFLGDRHGAIAEEAGRFAAERIATLPEPADDAAARVQAREILHLAGGAGLFRHAVSVAAAPDLRACCLVREALAAASPLADAVFALQALGGMPIALGGADALRERWLPEIAAGRAMAAFAMTEPEAGSDVSSLQTTARREPGVSPAGSDVYVLDGRKSFISNAGIADVYAVFAATDRAAGNRGISCFLVPAGAPGLRFLGPQVLSAPHPLGEIGFEECRVLAENRLGAEGEGFKLGMRTLDRLRPTVAATACGMA